MGSRRAWASAQCRPGDSVERIGVACGVPFPGVEVRCVEQGRTVARGEPGEVLVRGYNVMRGYLDDPVATAETIDPDGWLHTGDVGVLDAAGYLRITDRRKDMYIVGGFNCYPAEIEKIVGDAARRRAGGGDRLPRSAPRRGRAFVIRRAGTALDEAALLAWCRDNMANYKVPRRIEFVDALPTNAAGEAEEVRAPGRTARCLISGGNDRSRWLGSHCSPPACNCRAPARLRPPPPCRRLRRCGALCGGRYGTGALSRTPALRPLRCHGA